MASLSNINGIFDVHSTGAVQFNGNHGTAGQILKSNGNAAPTWVAASTVIGGPYLPLSGGTLTGATATASGISFTVGGALTGTSATFSGFTTSATGFGINYVAGATVPMVILANATTYGIFYREATPDYIEFKHNNVVQQSFDGSGNVTIAGDFTVSGGDITLGGTGRIQGVDTVTDSTDAANKAYVDSVTPGAGPFLPLAGGTVTGSTDFTAGTYPLDVYGIGSTAGSSAVGLGVYGSSSAGAIMHFHRPGAYAVNFGLDSDNVLRIGGWSASADRWTLDMSGNNTVAGSFTAGGVIYASGGNSNTWNSHTSNTGTLTSLVAGTGISLTNASGPAVTVTATTNFVGTTFTSRNSTGGIAVDSATSNMSGYCNASSAAGYADGGLFVAAYSSSWVSQIFSNFRTGEIAVRGKNSGTWQSWRTVWDSVNLPNPVQSSGVTSVATGNGITGGTITTTGTVSLTGTYTGRWNGTTGYFIKDTRAGDIPPNAETDHAMNLGFTNQVPGNGNWQSYIQMKGWSDGYASWQIIGPSTTTVYENWYLRAGKGGSWNTTKQIIHSGNISTQTVANATNATNSTNATNATNVGGLTPSMIVSGGSGRKSTRVYSFAGTSEPSGFYFGSNIANNPPTTDWVNYIQSAGDLWTSGNNYSFQLTHAFHSDNFWVSRTTNGSQSTARLVLDGGGSSQTKSGALASGTSMTAPIFYDTNTTYYGDFASTSNINALTLVGTLSGQNGYFLQDVGIGFNSGNIGGKLNIQINSANGIGIKNNLNGVSNPTGLLSYTSASMNAGGYHLVFQAAPTSGSDTNMLLCNLNGNLRNRNNSYGQYSDETIKENITDATPKLEDVKKLKVKNFNFIGDDLKQIGLIAQETEKVFPGLVEDDLNPQGDRIKSLKYSVLVPILVKAIQELEIRVKELENK
jgi:hypothetical protein